MHLNQKSWYPIDLIKLNNVLKFILILTNSNISLNIINAGIDQLKQDAIYNLNDLNDKITTLNELNGFINSNIITQQYISNLKCKNYLSIMVI